VQLVINTFGAAVSKEGERFVVAAGGREQTLSAHKVSSLLITTSVLISTDALQLAVAHNVDVVFLDKYGDPYGRVWQPRLGSTTAVRRRQIEAAVGPEGLALARGWVDAKLRHQAEFLDELAQRRPGAAAALRTAVDGIAASRAKLTALVGSLDECRGSVMGLEGTGGRYYFEALAGLMPETYRFSGRSRHPAKDAFNATLNYAYGVLYSHVERACILAGLDPCAGFLHTDNYAKPSLVFDLIEPFRIVADRTAVLLFTGRRAQAAVFEAAPGGIVLTREGRAALLTSLNERLEKAVRYPVRSRPGKFRNLKQRDVIRHEAHALANTLLGRNRELLVVETRTLWAEDAAPVAEDADDETLDGDDVVPATDLGEATGEAPSAEGGV
jgi:CRISPR-associated protein Cas1